MYASVTIVIAEFCVVDASVAFLAPHKEVVSWIKG